MFNRVTLSLVGVLVLLIASRAPAQTPSPVVDQPPASGPRKLTGDDARRARELEKLIDAAVKADRWNDAIARAEEVVALRTRVQGPKHFAAVNAEWRLKALRRVARMPTEDRVAYRSVDTLTAQVEALLPQGKYAEAQPLFEKVLEIHRRLLTDDHPTTANSYGNVGYMLNAQGKYAQAQPLCEKALEIQRNLLTDDHPDTAASCSNVAFNLNAQGKHAQAQPLFEKVVEVQRRLLTENHPATAGCLNNLAMNLNAQGKYTEAQPLFEKALAIRRRLLTDDDPDTATSYMSAAFNLNSEGNFATAQPLYEKALETFRRLLTDDHPLTASCYNALAMNLYEQGKYTQAQSFSDKALAIRRRLLTDDNPDTATSYGNAAAIINAQGNSIGAQPLFEKALEIRRRVLTDNHPETVKSYSNLATNLSDQGKYAQAQPLYEKSLEIFRRLLTDDHPYIATSYYNLAANLDSLGKYTEAQPLFEKALAIDRRLLTDEHPTTALSFSNLGYNLIAQGKYVEARDQLLKAAKILETARLRFAFTGMERAGTNRSARPALAAVLARLGQPAEAWRSLEEDLGRGLLDELTARQDWRLTPEERARLRELTAELEGLDRLVETAPTDLDKAERAKRYEDLKHRRELASIALGELQTKLMNRYGAPAGEVARLGEIQAALPSHTALVAWVDIPPTGPNAADPDGEHWGVVVRSRGNPAWVPIAGTAPNGLWTGDDIGLAGQVQKELRRRPGPGTSDPQRLLDRLRTQRLEPLAKALGAMSDGQPAARRLVILPSRAMAGIPVEALLAPADTRIVSYAPSATVFKYLREQPRPDRRAGFFAVGNPVYARPDKSNEPRQLPDHGLLVNVVVRGSNAATHGLETGDVLLAYNGLALNKKDDLKVVAEGDKPIVVDVWRDGRSSPRELAPGKLGVRFDPRPAAVAIVDQRKLQQVLVAARSGSGTFVPLPGTRYEVEAIAKLFKGDDRRTRILLGAEASEPALDRMAAEGELGRFGFIHLAAHGVIDEGVPARSAIVLTQTGLPDPLEQALSNKPVFDGRLLVREIQRGWDLKAELVTLSACETALGPRSGGEGFVGFTQALLMSGTRSVCLSLWNVDDRSTALLMQRFYSNLLGARPGLSQPMPKAEALAEAKTWLRSMDMDQVGSELAALERGEIRPLTKPSAKASASAKSTHVRPYDHPYYWAAFLLVGDPA